MADAWLVEWIENWQSLAKSVKVLSNSKQGLKLLNTPNKLGKVQFIYDDIEAFNFAESIKQLKEKSMLLHYYWVFIYKTGQTEPVYWDTGSLTDNELQSTLDTLEQKYVNAYKSKSIEGYKIVSASLNPAFQLFTWNNTIEFHEPHVVKEKVFLNGKKKNAGKTALNEHLNKGAYTNANL